VSHEKVLAQTDECPGLRSGLIGMDVPCRVYFVRLKGETAMRTGSAATLLGALMLILVGSLAAQDEKKINLQIGDPAPVFTATDDQGQMWKSVDHVGKKFVVVYFYPADFTSGCRTQAQKFRDNMNQLSEKGITVIGISCDASVTHALFKKAEKLNFTLLADAEGTIAKQFGVPLNKGGEVRTKDADGQVVTLKRNFTAARWTFIIGMDGKVVYKNTKVNPAVDSMQVGAFIDQLQSK